MARRGSGTPRPVNPPARSCSTAPRSRRSCSRPTAASSLLSAWITRCGCGIPPPAGRSARGCVAARSQAWISRPMAGCLLTGGTDGVARLWDVASGEPTGAIFRHDDTIIECEILARPTSDRHGRQRGDGAAMERGHRPAGRTHPSPRHHILEAGSSHPTVSSS